MWCGRGFSRLESLATAFGCVVVGQQLHYLRDCGLRHFLIEALTRAGKGVNSVVPTLSLGATQPRSTTSRVNCAHLAARARKSKGQLCFKISGGLFLLRRRGTARHSPACGPLSDQEPIQGTAAFGGGFAKV